VAQVVNAFGYCGDVPWTLAFDTPFSWTKQIASQEVSRGPHLYGRSTPNANFLAVNASKAASRLRGSIERNTSETKRRRCATTA
jgi:hypothetical protein